MSFNTISDNQYADLFKIDATDTPASSPSSFGMEETDTDILSNALKVETDPPNIPALPVVNTDTNTNTNSVDPKKEADILGEGITEQSKEPIPDFASFYESRVKAGKFVPIEQDGADGKPVQFVPKTPEEFEEMLDLQLNHRLQEKQNEVNTSWYSSKSDAWKLVAQYSELVDDPAQILPFLQGVQNIQSVAGIDDKEIEGAEQIVRYELEAKNVDPELIESQIETLKTKDQLISTAQKLKPVMIQREQQYLAQELQNKQQQQQQYFQMVNEIREEAIKAIEAPLFGKQKLKQEEKAIIYDLIAEPSPETRGYGIFSLIDSLFERKDFRTLTEIALLAAKKDSYYGYASIDASNKTAKELQNKLRIATDSKTTTSNDFHEEKTIQRRYKRTGEGGGFGYNR